MATSDARILANRRNAARSTGPKTPQGKARSRRNSLKHGLTGAGVVLPEEDAAEVSRRFEVLEAEMAPSNMMALILVQRVAMLSIRLERCVKQEATAIGEVMRNAASNFDDKRMAEVEHLMDWIAHEPPTNARRLRRTPEGVDKLIRAWLEVGCDLSQPDLRAWSFAHWQRMENLNGRRTEEFPISRDAALCKAIWDQPEFLEPGEVDGLDARGRREWARDQIQARIGGYVADLRALRETFDHEGIARDRDEAGQRAMFDPSKEAILARKYEAAAERGMYRALKELREVEAEARERPEPVETSDDDDTCDELGSSCDDPAPEPEEADPEPVEVEMTPREEWFARQDRDFHRRRKERAPQPPAR